ncbi:hypothetical protein [Romboutsia sp.]|uniref:hypothetical protein n=1 Tax=Romboutsia sp. TaxID=1965302 RepID=UPI003F41AA76
MENIKEVITVDEMNESNLNNKVYNPLKVIKPKSMSKTRDTKSSKGICTVINSKQNGKRLILAKETMDYLKNPSKIEVGFTEDGIVIAEKLPENGVEFSIKKSGNKMVIYSSELVKEITQLFNLDFSDRVSITFTESEKYDDLDNPIVKIKTR